MVWSMFRSTNLRSYRRRVSCDQAGFTLIELMVTVVVVAIFASIAVPSFTHLVQTMRVKSAANQLYDLLQYSRGQAVTTGNSVTIKAGSSSSSLWAGDVTVNVGIASIPSPTILREVGAIGLETNVQITSLVGALTFSPTGTTSTTACFKVTYTGGEATNVQYITVAPSGRVLPPSASLPSGGGC